ncbi:MAG: glycosyltransferase family 39 protein [Polyangiaceae bacterium]|nr:glycosyltransferase family 39 protein [Polyangiaceae bacterium]
MIGCNCTPSAGPAPAARAITRLAGFWPIAGVVLAAALLRLVDLGADPSPLKRFGDVSDEGYWAHEARLGALGVAHADELCAASAAAPLLSLVLSASFRVFGPSFAALHAHSAIAGTLLVAALAAFAAATWGPRCGLIAAVLAGFADAAVFYSRIGLPEMLQTLVLTATLLLLLRRSAAAAALAGAALGTAVLVKITAVYYGPAALAVLWYAQRGPAPPGAAPGRPALRALLAFAAGGAVPVLLWAWLWFWPRRAAITTMVRAMAENDTDGGFLSASVLKLPLNYFLGFPSVAILVVIAAAVIADPELHRGDRVLGALGLWVAGFLLALAFSADKSDRRFVPLIVPLVLVAARALDRAPPWQWSPARLLGAGGALALVGYDAFRGSLRNAFGPGVPRTLALLVLLAACLAALVWLQDRGRSRRGRIALAAAAIVFFLPAAATLFRRTHTIQAAARELGGIVGPGQLATGPLAHLLAVEAGFYPVVLTPGGIGIKVLNAGYDVGRIDYQLVVPSIMDVYGPLGLGRAERPVRVATLELIPDFFGRPHWTVDVFRFPRAEGAPLPGRSAP